MKRKTNLFYTSGEDSKFLTFSNYTEALTGNFLSTNIKVLPNKFICLNIPNITDTDNTGKYINKEDFIKNYLVAYYENKLAVLRDAKTPVNEMGILIETIQNYINSNTDDNQSSIEAVHIGNITEQDYNGTFTDIICVIDSSNIAPYKFDNITHTDSENPEFEPLFIDNSEVDYLYGWYDINTTTTYTGPAAYADVKPKYDVENKNYYVNTNYTVEQLNSTSNSVQFNVVIPVFTVINITDEYPINKPSLDIPLGIWFADKTIELTYDGKYGQSWSLAIGSQFKPLPNMDKTVSDVTDTSNKLAYSTFAQVLSRQNELLNKLEQFGSQITFLEEQIRTLQSTVREIIKK